MRTQPVFSDPAFAAVAATLFAGVFCFIASAVYHVGMAGTTTARAYQNLMSVDLWGIWAVNAGLAACLAFLLVPCAPVSLKVLCTAGPALTGAIWMLYASSPRERMAAFGVQLLVRVACITYASAWGLTHFPLSETAAHLLLELVTIVSATVNALRIPERWCAGRFDVTPINSHTFMHIFIAYAFFVHHELVLGQALRLYAEPQLRACAAL